MLVKGVSVAETTVTSFFLTEPAASVSEHNTNTLKMDFKLTFFRSTSDRDECAVENGGCQHTCTDSEGSFACSCNSGFELGADGRSCLGSSNYFSLVLDSFSNIVRSFKIRNHCALLNFADVNECVTNNPCAANQDCFNTYGGATCIGAGIIAQVEQCVITLQYFCDVTATLRVSFSRGRRSQQLVIPEVKRQASWVCSSSWQPPSSSASSPPSPLSTSRIAGPNVTMTSAKTRQESRSCRQRTVTSARRCFARARCVTTCHQVSLRSLVLRAT